MFKKATTAESGTSASSRSQVEKPNRRLSPVAFLASAAAALLTAGIVAGPLVSAADAAPASHATSHALATSGLGYTALSSPVRLADTRTGATDPSTYAGDTLAEGYELSVDVPSADVPSNASAVVVNVTAVNPAAAGFLSVFPSGATNPSTDNITFTAGQTVGNLVTVGLGPDSDTGSTQSFTVYNGPSSNGGAVDFTADLEGYYAPATATSGGAYKALTPARIYDSRTGSGQTGAGTTLTNGGSDNVTVTGVGGVPASATAVVLNVAVTNTTASSFISAYPTGSAPAVPTASQNFVAGETLSSQVISGVGTGGEVTIANHAGNADIVVDVDGYFTAPGGAGSLLTVLPSPVRLLDTRPTSVPGGSSATTTVQGTGATAGVLSLADIATGGNYLTAYATGSTAPLAANVNYTPGDTYDIVENSAYATTATGGGISILNGPSDAAPANIVVDEFGYFAPASTTNGTTYTVTPSTAQNVPPSTTSAPTAGDISYTATGLGTTPVDVELFNASGVTSASSGYTFTSKSGLATQGTVGAYIASVNGVAETGTSSQVNAITPVNGSITFTINSKVLESDYPVVFADDAAHTLPVNSSGSPTPAYGVGGEATWTAQTAAPGDYDVIVQTVDAANNTFTGTTYGEPATDSAATYTFSYASPTTGIGNIYEYSVNSGPYFTITEAEFASYLSGSTPPFGVGTLQTEGDEVQVEVGATGALSEFWVDNDVPAAPTAVAATQPNTNDETVSFTAPVNAVAPANNVAGYYIYAAPESATGTYTFPTAIPTGEAAIPAGSHDVAANDNGPAASQNPYDAFPTLPAGTYEFEIQAYNDGGNGDCLPVSANNGDCNSPLSAPSAPLTITTAAVTPVSTESVLTQGTGAGNNLNTLDTGDTLQFIYGNTTSTNPLTVASNASVTLVDSYGAEVVLTNGVNATFTVSGSTGDILTINVTGSTTATVPATPANGSPTPTALNTLHLVTGPPPHSPNVDAVLSETGIGTTSGGWNLPGSPTRAFYSPATSGGSSTVSSDAGLPAVFNGTVTATAPNTVLIHDNATGGTNAANGDPVTIYSAQGALLGTGTYSSTANTTITTTSSFLPGAALYVVYQDTSGHAGAFAGGASNQPSSAFSSTVPTPVTSKASGTGTSLTVTWSVPVTELASATPADYTVENAGGTVVATATAVSGSGTASFTLTLTSPLTNGVAYTLDVQPGTVENTSDQLNGLQSDPFTATPDTIAVLAGPGVGGTPVTVLKPTWSGTATSAGSTTISSVTATVGSAAPVTLTTVPATGAASVTWTYTPTANLPVGTTTVVFTVKDSAGGSATASETVTVADPKIAITTANPLTTGATSAPITGTYSVPTGATISSITASVNGGTPVGTTYTAAASGTWSFTASGLTPGANTVTFTATDSQGLTATASESVTVAPPTITANPYSDGTITGTYSAPSGATIASSGAITASVNGGTASATGVTYSSGTWSLTPTTALGFIAGTNTVALTVTDSSGATDTVSESVALADPTIAISTANPDQDTTSATSVPISGTYSAPSGVTIPSSGAITASVNGGTASSTGVTYSSGAWSFTASGLSLVATNTVTFTVTDSQGLPDTVTETIDVPPTIAITTANPDQDTTSATSVPILGTYSVPTGATISSITASVNGGTASSTGVLYSGGTWTFTATGLSLVETNTVTFMVTDSQGLTDTVTETIDVPPMITITGPNPLDTTEASAPITGTYSVPTGATISSITASVNGGTPAGTTYTPAASGIWSFTATGLVTGLNTVTFTVTDSQGLTDTVTETIDRT